MIATAQTVRLRVVLERAAELQRLLGSPGNERLPTSAAIESTDVAWARISTGSRPLRRGALADGESSAFLRPSARGSLVGRFPGVPHRRGSPADPLSSPAHSRRRVAR